MTRSWISVPAAISGLRILLAVVGVCLLVSCAPEMEAVSVATYNIKNGKGMDGVLNLNRTAAVINELDVALVSLQEVDFGVERSGSVQEAEYLSQRLSELSNRPWRYLNAPAIPHGGGEYGNAILYDSSVIELVSFRIAELPGAPNGDGRRSAGIALFRTACGPLQFVATHFTHRNNAGHKPLTYHEASVMAIQAAIDGNIPTLLAGDLNARSAKAGGKPNVLEFMKGQGWDVYSPKTRSTYVGGDAVIDHFAVRPERSLVLENVVAAINERSKVASDHYPVTARISAWGEGGACTVR